jgi:hypothetical protein
MSAVYRATDPNLRRMVAIKLIHTHLSTNPNFVSRFKEEAAAVARLRHPNIVQVYDFNTDGETYYMVMEYLVGETLQARLKRLNTANRNMPYTDVVRFGTQMCEAAGYAHKHELIHRDIKPANIMLDVNGQAILMDFGIVKIVGGEYHTTTGATIGTARYMSPEQMRSERADERSDIYSLGVTLYEMISGRTPYQADSVLTLMMMVLNDPLPDLREIRKGIPENLLAVVVKALEKEQKDRFQSMDEMATALQQAREQVASNVQVVTVVDDQHDEEARAQGAPIEAEPELKETSAELQSTEDLRRTERAVETPTPLHLEEGQRVSDVPTLKDLPMEPGPASPQTDLPTTRDAARPTYRRIATIATVLLLIVIAIAFGIYYLQAQKVPNSLVAPIEQSSSPINAQTAQSVVSLGSWETNSIIEDLAYSPDGKLIGTANNRNLNRIFRYLFYSGLWRVDTNSLQNYLRGHTEWVYSVAFSPDGKLFATGSDDDSVILWQASDGSQTRLIETLQGGIASVDFSPNNLLLATGGWGGNVGLWQVSDGHLLRTLQGHDDSVRDAIFSPDGKLLASASDDLTIKLWRVSEGNLERSLQGHSEPVYDMAFSTDGSLLASGSGDGTLRLWRITDGEMLHILTEHSDSITSLAFSPELAEDLLNWTRQHWGIENQLHYRRDVTLREDATRMQQTHQAQVVATLNNFVIALVNYLGFSNLASARRFFQAKFDALIFSSA